MKDIIFNDVSQGMNDKVSPRNLLKIDDKGNNTGPFPLLYNIDRSEGTFKTRGASYVQNVASTANYGAVIPGVIIGIHISDTIEQDYQASLHASYTKNIWLACRDSGADIIGRLEPISATGFTFMRVASLATGIGPAKFEQLDDSHILVYNGVQAKVIDVCNIAKDSLCKNFCSNAVIGADGLTIEITDVATNGTWNAVQRQLINYYLSFRVLNNWYGPFLVTKVDYSRATDRYTITLGSAVPVGVRGSTIDSLGAAWENKGRYFVVMGARTFGIPAPTRKCGADRYGTALLDGNLIGTYQYACTYENEDGYESNFGPWSDPITQNGHGALVSDIPIAGLTGDTWEAAKVTRVNLYRRGGTMGSTPTWIAGFAIPWMKPTLRIDDSMGAITAGDGSSNFKHIGYLNGLMAANYADWDVQPGTGTLGTTGANDGLSYWKPPGYMRYVNLTDGSTSIAEELIFVNNKNETTHKAIYTLRNVAGTSSSSWVNNSTFCVVSWYDTVADSELGTRIGPEDYDHAMPPQDVCFTKKSGNKLFLVSKAFPYQLAISSTSSWQYYRGDFAQYLDANNLWTGGVLNIGIDNGPITGIAEIEPRVLIVFKKDGCYSVTGKAVSSMVVDLIQYVPGCDCPNSIAVNKYGICWRNRDKVYWWDGTNTPVELTQTLSSLGEGQAMKMYFDQPSAAWGRDGSWGYAYDDIYRLHYTLESDQRLMGQTVTKYVEWDWRFPIYVNEKLTKQQIAMPSPIKGDFVEGMFSTVSNRDDGVIIYAARWANINEAPNLYELITTFGTGSETGVLSARDIGTAIVTTPSILLGNGEEQNRTESFIANFNSSVGAVACNVSVVPYHDEIAETTTTAPLLPAATSRLSQTLYERFLTDDGIYCRYPSLKVSWPVNHGTYHSLERLTVRMTGGREIVKPRQT